MLLNTLQCIGQSSQQRNTQSQVVTRAQAENLLQSCW